MAKEKISDLGSSVCVDDQNEKFVPALGNGAAIPGDLCAIDPTNGRVVLSATGIIEQFVGILMESKITGTETLIATDIPCKLVIPKSGHGYRIRCDNLGATLKVGHAMLHGTTAGKAKKEAALITAGILGRLSLEGLTGDTVCEVTWIQ